MAEAAVSVPTRILREREILRATLEELASSDYGGLTIERVAARAGVNKTTVYRHWPTKAVLVRAALSSVVEAHSIDPSTGSVRADLLIIGRKVVDFAQSFEGQCIMRLCSSGISDGELAEIARMLQAAQEHHLKRLIDEAFARGELRPGVDGKLLLDMLGGSLWARLMMKNERVDDVVIARIVDLLLEGALAPAARRKARKG